MPASPLARPPARLPDYLPTCSICLLTYLPTYLPTCLITYILLIYLLIHRLAHAHTHTHTHMTHNIICANAHVEVRKRMHTHFPTESAQLVFRLTPRNAFSNSESRQRYTAAIHTDASMTLIMFIAVRVHRLTALPRTCLHPVTNDVSLIDNIVRRRLFCRRLPGHDESIILRNRLLRIPTRPRRRARPRRLIIMIIVIIMFTDISFI